MNTRGIHIKSASIRQSAAAITGSRSGWLASSFAIILSAMLGCLRSDQPEVVVYTALDREFSEPILAEFEKSTGIRVRAKYDTESTKTVGLTNAILAEANRPRCDVFWNNEILNTLRLQNRGLLAHHVPPHGEDIPAGYRSADGLWHGLAARARVLLVNRELVSVAERPTSILELADPRWKGKIGIAKPLFGTTATHAAVLFSHWDDATAKDFFHRMKTNVQVLSGNKQVAMAVSRGQLSWGITDTDDAIIEIDQGFPVEIVFPDQQDDGLGTLLIPNTVAVIKDGPHPRAAGKLLDYLLSPEVEERLAESRSAQIPLNSKARVQSRLKLPEPLKTMDVDFSAAAAKWQETAEFVRDEFLSAD